MANLRGFQCKLIQNNFIQFIDQRFVSQLTMMPYVCDQLTRVRGQAAKMSRLMAPDSFARFDRIGPFFEALWHMKQDYLHVSNTPISLFISHFPGKLFISAKYCIT